MGADLTLWLTRFKLYARGSGIPDPEWKVELLSLLDDEAFRVANQLGMVEAGDYAALKAHLIRQFSPEGDDLEWQQRLQNRSQKAGESLAEFAGALRMLADRAYPGWEQDKKQELVRNQFIQGLRSATTQLQLMRDRPETPDAALQLALKQEEAVEAAQRRLRNEKRTTEAFTVSHPEHSESQAHSTCAVHGGHNDHRLDGLSRQLQQLSEQFERLQAECAERRSGRRQR